MTIDVDEIRQLRYTILPRNATDRTLSFSSSDEDVATISPEGYITGLQEGRTVIEAVSEDGRVTSDVEITVVTPVTAVTVTADRTRFDVGETIPIVVTLEPEEATEGMFDLSVSDRYVEIIDNSSLRTVSAGSVTITATALNGVYGYITIEVFDLAEMTAELFRLSNEVRANHGLTVFTQNDALTAAALVRAEESAILFAHQRPDGRGPFTAFTENEVEFLRAAENLAAGQVFAQQAVDGWMNSPGHRANILNPYLLQLGVAVVLGDEGRLYWIQVFTD